MPVIANIFWKGRGEGEKERSAEKKRELTYDS